MGEHEASKKPQTKVVAATGGSVAGSSVALLALMDGMPEWVKVLVILFGPPIAAFVSGYVARQAPPAR